MLPQRIIRQYQCGGRHKNRWAHFYNWWRLGEGGHGWRKIDGDEGPDAAPTATLVGDTDSYLFVAVKGLDGQIYLNQGELDGQFVGRQPM